MKVRWLLKKWTGCCSELKTRGFTNSLGQSQGNFLRLSPLLKKALAWTTFPLNPAPSGFFIMKLGEEAAALILEHSNHQTPGAMLGMSGSTSPKWTREPSGSVLQPPPDWTPRAFLEIRIDCSTRKRLWSFGMVFPILITGLKWSLKHLLENNDKSVIWD